MSFGESEAEWSTMPRSTLQPGAQPFVSLGQTAAALGVRFLPFDVKIMSAHLSLGANIGSPLLSPGWAGSGQSAQELHSKH